MSRLKCFAFALTLTLFVPTKCLLAQADTTPPIIQARFPATGSTVLGFNTVEVIFSEPVQGVEAADLLINNQPATDIVYGVPGQFVFEFTAPPTGQVSIAFAPTHGITDLATPPNPFAGATWNVIFNPNGQPATFLITEFMASNAESLNDEDGEQPDWIEIHNPRTSAGNLEGWFLTDDAGDLTKWRFPSRTVEAGVYTVVFASGKNRTNATGNLHTSFQLNNSGEYLALVDPSTNIVSAFSPVYPAQKTDVSYGRDPLNPNFTGFFATPTPRARNAVGGAGFAPEVKFSHNSRTFVTNQPFGLTLSTPLAGAVIYYTFGSNTPSSTSTNSFVYTTPIQITNTASVRARAFATGLLPGPISTKTFIGLANQTNVIGFNSDLPVMILHNYGRGTVPADKTVDHYVLLQTFETGCGRNSITNAPTLTARGRIHARGSSTITSSASKAAFFLELWDEFGEDLEESLFGLPAESDWVLYAPNNFEPALMHNPLAHALARDTGQYASRTRFFELYLKDDATPNAPGAIALGDYHGIYVLEEKIKRDNNRVDIAELQPEDLTLPDITGGYMFSIDRTAPGEQQLAAGGAGLNWIEPSYFTMTNAARLPQRNWIAGYLNSFNAGLGTTNYTNYAHTNFYGNYVDVDSWVTRHVHEVLTFNVDALRLSGYLYKDRGKKIEYGPAWDYDRTQGSTDNRDFNPRVWRSTVPDLGTDFFNFSPWWNRLFTAQDFWQAWIDKYQYLRRPGNAFHLDNVKAQVNRLANEVREAQPREVARWNVRPRTGNVSAGGWTHNFGPTSTYQNEVNWKIVWYSNRLDFMDTNFLPVPIFSSSGGAITNGYTVTINPGPKPGTMLYYTLDGTDPRKPGAGISPNALSTAVSTTLTLSSNVHIVGRSYNPTHRNQTGANNPPISSPWSGPVEAAFYTSLPALRITEIMYHPADPPAGSTNTQDDFEYIELTNVGTEVMDLTRFKLRGGVDFELGAVSLNPGQSGVLVRNQAAFVARYGSSPLILGVYTNDNLANAGEGLKLVGRLGEPILDFSYDDNWYPATDGAGFSLVIVNPNESVSNWGLKASWRPSGTLNGTPGASDPAATIPTVFINEISTHTDPPNVDAIELWNPDVVSAVNIGGWYLTDEFDTPKKYRIPDGTTIPANGYIVFYATNQANPALAFGRAFGLSSTGGEVYLYSANPATSNLTGYAQAFDFGAQANGVTFGRYAISTGGDHYPTMATPTLGSANSAPKVGPVIISEISYHPPDIQFTYRAVDNCIDEYIELQNTSGSPVPLFDTTNSWKLRDAVEFTFPPGASIPANGIVLVVPIDPANVQQATEFRTRNNVPGNVTLYGPFQGQLDNSSDSVELVRPDTANPDQVPYILVERVKYGDNLPWPSAADGFGPVLQRISLAAYGNDAANWVAGGKTPGTSFTPGAGPTITQQPVSANVLEGSSASFTVTATGPAPLGYKWLFNGNEIVGETAPTLTLPNVRPDQAGSYSALVYNNSTALTSSNAVLTVRPQPRILSHPANVGLRGSTNETDYGFTTNSANFTVIAIGSGAIRYQWRFNGVPINGATNPGLIVPNVDLTKDGFYDVLVSDDVATLTSRSAKLSVLIPPVFLQPPANQLVPSNTSFTASVVIKGNPTPFRFEWREISTVRGFSVTNSTTNFFTSLPVTNLTARTWRLIVTNEASTSGTIAQFTVTALPDTDLDGIPDDWETQYGLNPADGADRNTDSDQDGMGNYAEYIAGTDPTNPQSNLRVAISENAGAAQIQVGVLANHTYTLEYTDSLGTPAWTRFIDIPSGPQDRVVSVTDTGASLGRWYRLVTPRQR